MTTKPQAKTLSLSLCLFLIFNVNLAFADVRQQSFYKTYKPRQYISFGADHKSDENSKEHEVSLGYRYKSNKYIHEIDLEYETIWASTTRKPTRKTRERYEAELSSKMMLGQSKNYLSLFHHSEYDQFSKKYYDTTSVAGLGRMFFDGKVEADFNIGWNHARNATSEMVINPTLRVTFPISKQLKFSSRGFIFKREQDYDEKLDSRLTFRFTPKLSLDFIHKYKKDRFFHTKTNSNKVQVDRTYSIRIRYNF
ncbi:MAG: DUF481 domain-containing protein [Proteobacteria bacterium]|nr:DUF481 domain-containing protein [Pseudomonadota bacterium]